MTARKHVVYVRFTKAEAALLREVAGEEPLSEWLLRLALGDARRREAAASVARALAALAAKGPNLSDDEAARLAAEAKAEVRRRKKR